MAKSGEWKSSFRDVSIAVASLGIAAATIFYSVRSTEQERDAKLVEIGVSVLRVDPAKNFQVAGAREWALDLIDANAGVRFSPEARRELLSKPLGYSYDYSTKGDFSSYGGFGDSGHIPSPQSK